MNIGGTGIGGPVGFRGSVLKRSTRKMPSEGSGTGTMTRMLNPSGVGVGWKVSLYQSTSGEFVPVRPWMLRSPLPAYSTEAPVTAGTEDNAIAVAGESSPK